MTFPVHHTHSTAGTSFGTSVTPTIPTGTVSGDTLIAILVIDFDRTVATPSGWAVEGSHVGGGGTIKTVVYSRTATGSDTDPTFDISPSNEGMHACILRSSGVSTITVTFDDFFSATTHTCPANGTATTDALVYRQVGLDSGADSTLTMPATAIFNETGGGGGGGVWSAVSEEDISASSSVPTSNATTVSSVTSNTVTVKLESPAGRSITNIDGDNDVQAGQTSVAITGVDFDLPISTVTLGGETLTVTGSPTTTNIDVDVPLHIDLEWGSTTNQLAVTDNTGTLTLDNVTLSTPTGWETVTFNGSAPNPTTTESYYEEAQTDLTFTMAVNDILAWESATGLTVDVQTLPFINPPNTSTGDYKIWDTSLSTWTAVASYTWIDGGQPTAAVLSSPTGTETSDTTASGTVSTDTAAGTLYFYTTTNASETANDIRTNGDSQTVTATGVQNVSVTGLTASTTYYIHYLQDNGVDSNVVSSASFTTDASPDVTPPVLSLPTGTETGAQTADGTVTTDESNGTLYFYVSTNSSETAGTIKASGDNQSVTAIGVQNVSFINLTPSTVYYAHYVHDDASTNESNVVSSASFTTDAIDTTPPVLSSPLVVSNTSNSVDGSVSTDEGNGILYFLASTNATETAVDIRTMGLMQTVTTTGVQNVTYTGLSPETLYYLHFVQEDDPGNVSNVVTTTSFTTDAAPDTPSDSMMFIWFNDLL